MKKILLPHQLYYPYVDVIKDRSTKAKEVKFKKALNQRVKGRKAMIYLHVPYCDSACSFCGFFIKREKDHQASLRKYFSLLKKEIDFYSSKPYIKGLEITGIHIGGGTPTYLSNEMLGQIIDYLRKKFKVKNVPLNLEGSASTINQETIKLIKKKNISRVSIGVQSFNPELRRKLRIRSTLEEVLKLIPTLKKEGITIYIDLMYGFPNMGLGDYKKIVIEDVKKAIKLGVDGLDFSQYFPFYNPLGETIKKEKLKFPSAKKIIDIIKTGTKLLEEAGYIHVTEYGFCKKGEIMLEKTYFGDEQIDAIAIGPRALGTLNGFKFMNGSYFEDEVPAYILMKKLTKTEIERAPIVAFPKLLRLNKKVFTPSLHKEYKKRFDKLKKEKLIIETPEYYELTAKGKYFINNIYLMLMESKEIERIKKQIKILALK